MKQILHNIKCFVVLVAVAVAAVGCEQENGYQMTDGVPTVHYVRTTDPAQADSLLTGAYMENLICIVGENLRSVHELWFNDQKAILNTSYITDNTLLVTVPGTIPSKVDHKMYLITAAKDTVTHDFNVLVPGPTLTGMKCEMVPAGGTAVITGDYFVDEPNTPLTVTLADGTEINRDSEGFVFDKYKISFTVPENAPSGKLTVSTIYGSVESSFHLNDSRGLLFTFDGEGALMGQGWKSRPVLEDEWSLTGKYMQLGDGVTPTSGWPDGQYAFHHWAGSWDTPQNITSGQGIALNNIVDFTDFANMSLKFEMCVPKDYPWSSGGMQIAFEGLDRLSLSSNPIDGFATVGGASNSTMNGDNGFGTWGRAIYVPWTGLAEPFHTDNEWITVTIPFSDFNLDNKGNPTGDGFASALDFACLTIFVWDGDAYAGVSSTPIMKIDNIRAVPNR